MIFTEGGRVTTRNIPTDRKERETFCISDPEVLVLAGQAITIEEHYSAKAGVARPMDIEWAKDGLDGRPKIFAPKKSGLPRWKTQSRSSTGISAKLEASVRVST